MTAVTLREIVQGPSTVHKWTRLRRRYLLAGIGGIIVLLWSGVMVAAPEPSSIMLLSFGILGLAILGFRKRRKLRLRSLPLLD